MPPIMPTPQQVSDAPEMALVTALAYTLQATRITLAASYPALYEDQSDLDHDHTEQSAYARAIYGQVEALLPLLDGYLASALRAISFRHRLSSKADDTDF